MSEHPVVVVGAGLAGLACAARLHREGVPVLVLERGDEVGGRVRTDLVDGFVIDRGFQVINTAYPALRRSGVLAELDLRELPRGVRLRSDGHLHDVPHPLASPAAPLRVLTSAVTGLRGKVALAGYAGALVAGSTKSIKNRPDVTAAEAWSRSLPDDVVRNLLIPFLSGVVLEQELTTTRVFTDLMMRMFAAGSSAVPAAGMQALPRALAARLPHDAVRLDTAVTRIDPMAVTLEDGATVPARAVVVATDPWTAHDLVPELGSRPQARGVTTHYFAARPWTGIDGTLVVDADGSAVLNSVVLTASAPEYSADGRALIAASTLDCRSGEPEEGADAARHTAAELHGAPHDDWEHIATRRIPCALPAMTAPHRLTKPAYVLDAGVWVAGDHRDTSSIQGALASGNRVALSLLRLHADGPVLDGDRAGNRAAS
ncbi:MAG: hypothetical protein JWP74_1425 [Marmoricola sp.]|nr:hypothetical protein [Marmoricola sp.]